MRPSKLHFQEYGHMPHAGYGLIIKQDKLYAYHSILGNNNEPESREMGGNPLVEVPEPSEKMWDDFYQILCDIKVKEWSKSYVNMHILDGGGWIFKIRFKDINRSIRGDNDEPQAIVLNGIRVLPKQVLHKAIEELSSGVLTKVMDQDLYGGYWEE